MSRCCSDEPRGWSPPPSGALSLATVGVRVLSGAPRLRADGEGGGDYAEDLAARMLASTLGVEFDEDRSWDEKREVWKISGKIYRSFNITQSAIVKDEYTTVLAAAVLVS